MAVATVAPSIPAAKAVSGEARQHFDALKGELGHIVSWELSPNSWDKIQIRYTEKGSEEQARCAYGVFSIKSKEDIKGA